MGFERHRHEFQVHKYRGQDAILPCIGLLAVRDSGRGKHTMLPGRLLKILFHPAPGAGNHIREMERAVWHSAAFAADAVQEPSHHPVQHRHRYYILQEQTSYQRTPRKNHHYKAEHSVHRLSVKSTVFQVLHSAALQCGLSAAASLAQNPDKKILLVR